MLHLARAGLVKRTGKPCLVIGQLDMIKFCFVQVAVVVAVDIILLLLSLGKDSCLFVCCCSVVWCALYLARVSGGIKCLSTNMPHQAN